MGCRPKTLAVLGLPSGSELRQGWVAFLGVSASSSQRAVVTRATATGSPERVEHLRRALARLSRLEHPSARASAPTRRQVRHWRSQSGKDASAPSRLDACPRAPSANTRLRY